MGNSSLHSNIQQIPLSERDCRLLESMRSVGRGDGYVARGVGVVLLLMTVLILKWCWQRSPFDWSLLAGAVFVGLLGWFLIRLGRRKRHTADIFGTLLKSGIKQVVSGRLESADILANGAICYRVNGEQYEVHVPFMQPYPFISILDKAYILPTENITLHLISRAPGSYYRLLATVFFRKVFVTMLSDYYL